jgi:hypothetical protein
MYDWEEDFDPGERNKPPWKSWLAFPPDDEVEETEHKAHKEESIQALEIEPKAQKVGLGESIRALQATNIKKSIKAEVEENISLYRTKKGLDTKWDTNPKIVDIYEQFLKIMDMWTSIDVDYDGLTEVLKAESNDVDNFIREVLKPERWNIAPLDPNTGSGGEERYTVRSAWTEHQRGPYNKFLEGKYKELKAEIGKFLAVKKNLPVATGKRMRGFPVHFSTSEPDRIREYLQRCEMFKEFKDLGTSGKAEDVSFTVACFTNRLDGAILSVWFYIAVQEPKEDS